MPFAFVENNLISLYPIDLYDVRQKFPEANIQSLMQDQDLSALGVVEVVSVAPPTFNEYSHRLQEKTPEFREGSWFQCWEIIELTDIEKRFTGEKLSFAIRVQRDQLLRNSDWTQMPDALVDGSKWKNYRQELRDITQQAGFPFEVVWPEEPV